MKPYEEKGYWRDVGNLQAYWSAHMDLLGAQPRFDLNNRMWPIHSQAYHRASPRVLSGTLEDCSLGVGSVVDEARIVRSIIGRNTWIESGAEIVDSIVMDHCRIGHDTRIHRGIVDRYNFVQAWEVIAADAAAAAGGREGRGRSHRDSARPDASDLTAARIDRTSAGPARYSRRIRRATTQTARPVTARTGNRRSKTARLTAKIDRNTASVAYSPVSAPFHNWLSG